MMAEGLFIFLFDQNGLGHKKIFIYFSVIRLCVQINWGEERKVFCIQSILELYETGLLGWSSKCHKWWSIVLSNNSAHVIADLAGYKSNLAAVISHKKGAKVAILNWFCFVSFRSVSLSDAYLRNSNFSWAYAFLLYSYVVSKEEEHRSCL